MATIAALTPPEVEVSLVDENVTRIDYLKDVDLVGITSLTSTSQRAYEIADTFRAMGKKVVLGGIHASVLPEEAIQHADAVVGGGRNMARVNCRFSKEQITEILPSK
jgi:radical SAM superfamily enzyme YgiQ (UPF0313 family)